MTGPDHNPILIRALALRPATLDREARTVEAVVSTGATVRRTGFDGPFDEVLPVENANLARFVGAPVLNAHQRGSTQDVLGVVTAVQVERGALISTLKFSRRAEAEETMGDVADGVLSSVSLGHTVEKWRETRGRSGAVTRTAEAWTPLEVSFVPVGADPGARVRCSQEVKMAEKIATRDGPTAENLNDPPLRNQAAATEIRAIARAATLSEDWIEGQFDAMATADQARAAAMAIMRERQAPIVTQRATVGFSNDDPSVIREREAEALYARVTPGHKLSDEARPFF